MKKEMTEIAPNVFKKSDKCFYIKVNGVMKFCIAERYHKLLEKHGGDHAKLVEGYRTRSAKPKADTPVAAE